MCALGLLYPRSEAEVRTPLRDGRAPVRRGRLAFTTAVGERGVGWVVGEAEMGGEMEAVTAGRKGRRLGAVTARRSSTAMATLCERRGNAMMVGRCGWGMMVERRKWLSWRWV